jgi:general secretion pathway protein H
LISGLTAPTVFLAARLIIKMSPVGKVEAQSAHRGFSLLELLLVLSLLGISTLIVLPALDKGLKQREAKQSALGLAAVARDLRRRAIYEGTLQRLVLNSVENSYHALSREKVFLPADAKIVKVRGGELTGEESRQFLFFPNGSLLGGEISLVGSGEGTSYTIELDSLSGRVMVRRGEGE